ncbi:MAG: ABC transporter substrate binding protein [Hydrogenobacter sp.]
MLKGEQVKSVPFEKVRDIKLVVNERALREQGMQYNLRALSLVDQIIP